MFRALGASVNVLVVVLASWISEPVYGQSCSVSPQQIVAYREHNKTITSPGYPSNYGRNLICTWRLQVGTSLNDVVKVTFNDFEVGSIPFRSCYGDHLNFYDGDSTMSNLLGSYCGTMHPEVIYSTGPFLYVKFSSSSFDSYKGFSFNVAAVAKDEAAGICREASGGSRDDIMQLSAASGIIFSPDYPYTFPRGTKCIWVISVPAGKRVRLSFQAFDLGFDLTQCKYHSNDAGVVEIRDGKYSWNEELARYCSYNDMNNIRDIYSTGNHMRITFSFKSSYIRQRGFKARYEVSELSSAAYSKEKCYYGNVNNEKLNLSGTYGTFESPKEGSSYPPNMRCDWVITVPEGKIVKLSFDEFQLEPDYGSCDEDYVEVRDGKESFSASKGTFCGFSTPADILSSGRFMRVSFRSDSDSTNYDGFKATFTAEKERSFSEQGSSTSSSSVIVAVIVGVIVFVICICVLVCVAKWKQSAAARTPMATQTTTAVSPTTQAGVIHHPTPNQQPVSQPLFQTALNPYPPPPVGFAPAPSDVYPPPPLEYPYPLQPPPPYPGTEQVPQYPPPGQSYPWQQSVQVEPSAPPKEP